jgi:3-oxoacyl-[acyl-carrier protein] reductase
MLPIKIEKSPETEKRPQRPQRGNPMFDYSSQPLKNKIALVTGAGRGIGAAIACAYGRAGAQVVCAARTPDQIETTAAQITAAGGEALAITTDVTDQQQVSALYRQTEQAFGGLDIVLINAGGNFDRDPVGVGKAEDWVAVIQLNLIAAYYCAREAIPYLTARGGGKILTMGSGMGHRGMPGQSSYCVSKAGLWMLTQVLAQELIEHNISVNEIIPGPVLTELSQTDRTIAPQSTPFAIKGEWIKPPEDVTERA